MSPVSTGSGSPFFYMGTDRSFSPGEETTINLEGPAGGYDFRVYEIEDPISYFESRVKDRLVQEKTGGAFADPINLISTAIKNYIVRFREQAREEFRDGIRPHLRAASGIGKERSTTYSNPAVADLLKNHKFLYSFSLPEEEGAWSYRRVPVPIPGTGVYLVEGVRGEHTAHTLVNRTSLSFAVKQTEENSVVFVADRETGTPVEGARVILYDRDGAREVGSAVSDSSGQAKIQSPTPARSLVLAKKGDDIALSDPEFYSSSFYGQGGKRVYLYTDRPVYRPGESVHFKVVVRNYRNGYSPVQGEVTARLYSATGAEASEPARISLSGDTGTGAGTLDLVEGKKSHMGAHNLVVDLDGKSYSTDFYVETTKLPPFRLSVTPDRASIKSGEEPVFKIHAVGFTGGPITGKRVSYRVTRRPLYFASPVGRLTFDAAADYLGLDRHAAYREPVLESSGELDQEGNLVVKIPGKKQTEDSVYTLSASVHSGSLVVSSSGSLSAHRAPFYILSSQEERITGPDQDLELKVNLIPYDRDLTGEKRKELVNGRDLKLEVYRKSFFHISAEKSRELVVQTSGKTGADGSSTLKVRVKDGGQYVGKITATSPSGDLTESTMEFWVSGKSTSVDDGTMGLSLRTGRDLYAPGDNAEVLINSPISDGTVFITLEGERIYKTETIHMTGRSHVYKIPITKELSPGFTLAAVQFSGNKSFKNETKIQAPPLDRFLKVRVTPEKAKVRPGQQASIQIETKDWKGRGVSSDISVAVVDEAIYSIRNDETPDPGVFFYHPRRNNTGTTLSSSYRFFGYSEERRMNLARNDSDLLAGLKGESTEVREFFPVTAFWSGSIRTDRNGLAKVSFPTPHSTTRWRVVVRAVTADTRAGAGEGSFETWKELESSITLAAAYYRGMEFPAIVTIKNRSEKDQTVKVTMEPDQALSMEKVEKSLPVKKGESQNLSFNLSLPAGAKLHGKPALNFTVQSEDFQDRIKVQIPVRAFAMRKTVTAPFYLKEDDSRFEVKLPEIEGSLSDPELSVRMTPGGSEALREALVYLADYPYGCVEQTMSRFMPLLALKQSSLADPVLSKRLPDMIRVGVSRLSELQNSDGSYGWFSYEEKDGDPLMSAYVYTGFTIAAKQGVSLNKRMATSLRRFLYRRLSDASLSPDLRAYIIHSLSTGGPVEASLLDGLYKLREKMETRGLAITARVLLESDDRERGKELFEKAFAASGMSGEPGIFPAGLSESRWERDSVETAADLLHCATALGDEEKIRILTMNLLYNRQGPAWKNSRDTSAAVLSLASVIVRQNRMYGEAFLKLETKKGELARFQYDPTDPDSSLFQTRQADSLAAKGTFLLRKGSGPGLVGNLTFSALQESKAFQPEGTGIQVERKYGQLTIQKSDGRNKFVSQWSERFKAGDLVHVALHYTIEGEPQSYFMIEDPIPQGFQVETDDNEYYDDGRKVEYVSREAFEDRTLFFVRGPVRSGTIHYFLRASIPGKSRVLPASVQLMYYPEIQGRTGDQSLEVQK